MCLLENHSFRAYCARALGVGIERFKKFIIRWRGVGQAHKQIIANLKDSVLLDTENDTPEFFKLRLVNILGSEYLRSI